MRVITYCWRNSNEILFFLSILSNGGLLLSFSLKLHTRSEVWCYAIWFRNILWLLLRLCDSCRESDRINSVLMFPLCMLNSWAYKLRLYPQNAMRQRSVAHVHVSCDVTTVNITNGKKNKARITKLEYFYTTVCRDDNVFRVFSLMRSVRIVESWEMTERTASTHRV